VTAVEAPTPTTRRAVAGSSRRRLDIDGLRAFAIVLVVVYHVWLGRVSGGVDVFLLISAYFLTASFVARSSSLAPIDLLRFWARRFARLLPAAAVTILGVLLFTAVVLPGSQWRQMWTEAWSSLFYVQNRALTASAVDYYARSETFPSALQHFWSLSVQGQVFLLWPVLVFLAVVVARWIRRPVRPILIAGFGLTFCLSLAYSIHLTAADQQVAYFSVPARLWEFALGSLAALLLPRLRLPRWWAGVVGWAGIGALIACGIVLDVGAGFPGVAALWPTLAAVLIIVAGQSPGPGSASRWLGSRPMVWIGGIAYALYLVHWPILVAYMTLTDSTSVGAIGGLVVIVTSVAAAVLLAYGVERPLSRLLSRGRRNLAVIGAAVLAVALPLGTWQAGESIRVASYDPQENPGAHVLMPWLGVTAVEGAPVRPVSTQLGEEWVALDGPCTDALRPAGDVAAATCVQTEVDPDAPMFLVIGDSHAQQWMGAVLPVLEEAGWNIVALLRGGCSFAPDEDAGDECAEWREEARAYAESQPADVVMLMGTKAAPSSPAERQPLGLERPVASIAASGSQVLLVRDNPRYDFDMYGCLEASASASDCAMALDAVMAPENPALGLTEEGSVYFLDLSEYLCPEGVCLPAIGNVAVYIDDNHLTASYAQSLAPAVLAAFRGMPGVPLG
jgi:peptidoglycan/LPS O-acetylase OafA/YrhL